mgnify:CR=1 FL=1
MQHHNTKLTDSLHEFREQLSTDPIWAELIAPNKNWKSDPVFPTYHLLSNKQKGVAGEHFVHGILEELGAKVMPPLNSDHDRIVNGHKVEIKFSLATSKGKKIQRNNFIMNHVAKVKDWDFLLFAGINPLSLNLEPNDLDYERCQIYLQSKADFLEYMEETPYSDSVFKYQQSGKKGKNDDYICSGKGLLKWTELDSVKTLDEWLESTSNETL